MKPKLRPEALEKTAPWEYVVRFVFGGVVTAGTGLVAHHFGPDFGGLFVAFPAILPASLTLVNQHDGRARAVDDARGACLGSVGLAAFAVFTWLTAASAPGVLVLGIATLVWLTVSAAAWTIAYGVRWSAVGVRREPRPRPRSGLRRS